MNSRFSSTSIVNGNAGAASVHLRANLEDLIADPVVHTDRVSVANSIDPLAVYGHDLGVAPWSLRLEGGTILLRRSADHEVALLTLRRKMRRQSSKLTSDQLTAEELAICFGLNDRDLDKLILWMRVEGLESITLSPDRMSISFSGDLLAVEAAFSTGFRRYRFKGRQYFASAYDLSVPRALAPVIGGFRNFRIPVPQRATKQKEDDLGNGS